MKCKADRGPLVKFEALDAQDLQSNQADIIKNANSVPESASGEWRMIRKTLPQGFRNGIESVADEFVG